jgi:hypothetical protein
VEVARESTIQRPVFLSFAASALIMVATVWGDSPVRLMAARITSR